MLPSVAKHSTQTMMSHHSVNERKGGHSKAECQTDCVVKGARKNGEQDRLSWTDIDLRNIPSRLAYTEAVETKHSLMRQLYQVYKVIS